jgi:uncharacterized protein
MQSFLPHNILGNTFLLSANKTIFWEEEKALILSDLHLGKSGHFRKAGIAIPQNIIKEDLFRLMSEIQFFKPKKVIIVGDLFHSTMNKEHELFLRWRKEISHIVLHLVKGNHDILDTAWYEAANIIVHENNFTQGRFIFTHDVNDEKNTEEKYCFSGHIHPSIIMKSTARQNMKLTCFYFSKNYAVLPAFGKFTGTFSLTPKKGDSVFVLVENKIIQMQ